jgi:hypothetical protein
VEPLTILVEGGKDEDSIEWRAILHPVVDDGFSMNSITLYGFNFTDLSAKTTESNLDQVIDKIGSR